MKKDNFLATGELLASMIIFGTIGIFRRYLPFSSGFIAMIRGLIGVLFLSLILLIKRKKPSLCSIKKNAALLIVSGALIGFNWMLLFEAYNYTSVATATLCYYMAPIFVIIFSPLLLKEKLTVKKAVISIISLFGMLLVSGVMQGGVESVSEIKGIIFGLGAAMLYAAVIILNKKLSDISSYDRCTVQLGTAFTVLIPYVIFAEDISSFNFTPINTALLITVGILHTGIAYALYFDSIGKLEAGKVAIFGYIDPILAVILSALILDEKMSLPAIIGALLIIGATFAHELPQIKRKRQDES